MEFEQHCVTYFEGRHVLARASFCIAWPNETAASGGEGTAEASEGDEHDLDAENENIEHTVPQQVLHGQGV